MIYKLTILIALLLAALCNAQPKRSNLRRTLVAKIESSPTIMEDPATLLEETTNDEPSAEQGERRLTCGALGQFCCDGGPNGGGKCDFPWTCNWRYDCII